MVGSQAQIKCLSLVLVFCKQNAKSLAIVRAVADILLMEMYPPNSQGNLYSIYAYCFPFSEQFEIHFRISQLHSISETVMFRHISVHLHLVVGDIY